MASRKAADFTKYLQILPSNIIQHEINKFPVTNPWRSFRKKSAVHPDEAELAEKRSKILSEQKISTIQFPSVTKVLSATMPSESRIALYRWRKKMIAQLGEDGFQQLTQKNFRRGRELHKNIHNKLMAREDRIVINEELEPFWHSLSSVFPMMSDVKLMEGSISHPFLCYKGIVDCVARYEKKPMAIDWKTSTREKPNLSDLYDNPIQVVAYMGALNYDPHHNFQVKNAAIVVAYEDGKSADVHILSSVDIKIYWEKWIQRLSEYWKSQASVKTREDKENISL